MPARMLDYSGATGEMEFDANGDIPGVIGHFVVDGTGYKAGGLGDAINRRCGY